MRVEELRRQRLVEITVAPYLPHMSTRWLSGRFAAVVESGHVKGFGPSSMSELSP